VRLELGRGIALGKRFVPTDESMRMPVNYGQAGRFRAISAAEVITGQADPATFAGRIVLIGGTAAGVGDSFATPFSPQMPGIARHATVIDSILRQDFLVRRKANALLELAAVVLAGLLIGAIAGRRGLLAASIACALALAALAAFNLYAFMGLGLWLNLFLPLAAIGGIYLPVLAYSYFVEQRQERRIRAAFKHYLSPALVDQVARDPALLRLGGEQKELTVLFADVRNSTGLAAKLPPPAFAQLLNEVMDTIGRVLFAHGGMLDKFTGDGLVAVFDAPLPQPDHALRACRAALAMQGELAPLQARWSRPDLPPLEIGVGINTGSMIIGNMGSKDRFSYTVVGDEANLGARLEAANKEFRTRILISEATWQRVKDKVAARELEEVTFRGMDRPVRVFELLGEQPLPGQAAAQAELFAAALAAYRSARWAAAAALFGQLVAMTPADRPSQLYLERCRQHLAQSGAGHAAQRSCSDAID
jgi:adenylate cyclase